MFVGGKLWQISHQKLLVSKTLANSCLFAFFINFMSWDIVKFRCKHLANHQWFTKFTKVFLHQFTLCGISWCVAKYVIYHIICSKNFWWRKLWWQISDQNFWRIDFWWIPACLLSHIFHKTLLNLDDKIWRATSNLPNSPRYSSTRQNLRYSVLYRSGYVAISIWIRCRHTHLSLTHTCKYTCTYTCTHLHT